jgi:hypothetical protein
MRGLCPTRPGTRESPSCSPRAMTTRSSCSMLATGFPRRRSGTSISPRLTLPTKSGSGRSNPPAMRTEKRGIRRGRFLLAAARGRFGTRLPFVHPPSQILPADPVQGRSGVPISTLAGCRRGWPGGRGRPALDGASRRSAQHFAVLRFLPTVPFFRAFSMYSGAYGTLHDVSPTSTNTLPSFWAICMARSVSGCT